MICEQERFSQLMLRMKQGDTQAFESILNEYGDAIRREVHFTLLDTQLRRFVGNSDVYQSVVIRFFDGMRNGKYTIEQPQELIKLLKGIARNRIAELVRFWHAQRRDLGRSKDRLTQQTEHSTAYDDPNPLDGMMQAEVLAAIQSNLTSTDRQILQWRTDGFKWSEIADQLGNVTAEAIRKQHDRALSKIAASLATCQ